MPTQTIKPKIKTNCQRYNYSTSTSLFPDPYLNQTLKSVVSIFDFKNWLRYGYGPGTNSLQVQYNILKCNFDDIDWKKNTFLL